MWHERDAASCTQRWRSILRKLRDFVTPATAVVEERGAKVNFGIKRPSNGALEGKSFRVEPLAAFSSGVLTRPSAFYRLAMSRTTLWFLDISK